MAPEHSLQQFGRTRQEKSCTARTGRVVFKSTLPQGLRIPGKMKPVIDKTLPLEEAAEGLRLIQDREVIGKVIVTP